VVRVLGGVGRATVEVEVWRRATQLGDIGGAATLSVLQLLLLGAAVWAAQRAQRRQAALRLSGRPDRPVPRGRQRSLVALGALATAGLVVAPLAALIERSLRLGDHYSLAAWRSLFTGDPARSGRPSARLGADPIDALGRSVGTALWATLFAVVLGGAAICAIDALGRRGRWLDIGLMLPLGTSAVTIGFGMLITFDTAPFDWRASWWLVPLGHALVATPFVVRAVLPVLRAIPPDQRAAAATLGASPLRTWLEVDVRRLLRPLVSGAGFAAAISLGEFGATTFLTRAGRETVPIAIARLLGRAGELPRAQGFALATMLLVVTAAIVAFADRPAAGDA